MKFKEYLITEREMSFEKALQIFGISAEEAADKRVLKSKYRTLSMENHPDRGGSEEKQKDINDAYAVLDKAQVTVTSKERWEERDRKYRAAGSQIKTALLSNFQPDVFINYFQELSGNKYTYEIKRTFPIERDRSPSYAGFDVEFFTPDRSSVFTFKVFANLHDIVWPKAELGHGDLQYNVMTEAHGFHNNKKQKMSRSDWKFTRDHSFFRKPEQLFPKKKMKDIFSGKTSKRKFQKRDMIAFLTKKLGADWDGEWVRIPLGDDYKLVLFRTTLMRQGAWSVNGIYHKHSRVEQPRFVSFMEEEETAKILEKIQKEAKKAKGDAKVKKTKQLVAQAYEAYKKMKGI